MLNEGHCLVWRALALFHDVVESLLMRGARVAKVVSVLWLIPLSAGIDAVLLLCQ